MMINKKDVLLIRPFKFFVVLLFYCILNHGLSAQEVKYIEAEAVAGDGIHTLLKRFNIDSEENVKIFIELNKDRLNSKIQLIEGKKYLLPKKEDTKLVVPENSPTETKKTSQFSIFGKKYQDVEIVDNQLYGAVYYIVAGHGGPDPGAQGFIDSHTLCEDEYAYDISLRLTRELLSHGALVYMIIRDTTDGIRDEAFLECDNDELCWGNLEIPLNQKKRLRQRCEAVNGLYNKFGESRFQRLIVLHVDSRSNDKRVDIFFYHHSKSKDSQKLAESLRKNLEDKYGIFQPKRGYTGEVKARDNLYMIGYTSPKTVYIELGNIKNERDQQRFIKSENRQLVAKWLGEGLLNEYVTYKK